MNIFPEDIDFKSNEEIRTYQEEITFEDEEE